MSGARMGIARGYHRIGPRDWRYLCALALSTSYSLLLLLASLCVATGLFHDAAPHDVHHHHAYPGAHHHADADAQHHTAPDAPHPSPLLDICDVVHQVFTATVLDRISLPALALPSVQALVSVIVGFIDSTPSTPCSIRAPPSAVSRTLWV